MILAPRYCQWPISKHIRTFCSGNSRVTINVTEYEDPVFPDDIIM